ncbi:MAG: non-canonical purine NTP pyrophosphatase, partial [Thermotogaceae bacterium]|nr:non-canonical purine NTP pyrophosphatase [Thermotogaceae bacterium]
MEIILATKNLHKIEELKKIVPENVKVVGLPKEISTAPEYGENFLENAIYKALWYMKVTKKPVVADDSGLEIDALKGFPGVFSSRFMEGENYRKKMEKILKMLDGEKNRKARFVCQA